MSKHSDNTSSYFSRDETYYDILSIKKNATSVDIRNAYDKLAQKWNPNNNNKMETNRVFLDINNAYQVLSNPDAKREYDYAIENSQRFKFDFRDPFDVYDDFMALKTKVKAKFDNKLDDILCQIKPKNPPQKYVRNIILSRELVLINEQPFEKITEQDLRGTQFITYVHPNGLKQRVMDDHFLNNIIDETFRKK